MKKLQRQKGFTLVELAIVLTIIGLLLGGILKGQALIANARVTSQIAQIKGVESATTTFEDSYGGLPGDLGNAAARLPTNACAGPCANAGVNPGDGIIGAASAAPTQTAAGDNAMFWWHLTGADLINGVTNQTIGATFGGLNGALPQGKVGGGLVVNNLTGGGAAYPLAGIYITVGAQNVTANLTAPAANAGVMTPNQAAQIDRKTDDGTPASGSVIGSGAACVVGAIYNEVVTNKNCAVSWRIHQ